MALTFTGIKGYVGELIVSKWLKEYLPESYIIQPQIIPANIDTKGGPYLDIAVINKAKEVELVCEVKTQDYILDGKESTINKSLLYLWGLEKGKNKMNFKPSAGESCFIQSNKEEYFFSSKLKSILVVMVPPNQKVMDKISDHVKDIILLSDILKECEDLNIPNFSQGFFIDNFVNDLKKVMENIKRPKNGKKILPEFRRKNSINPNEIINLINS